MTFLRDYLLGVVTLAALLLLARLAHLLGAATAPPRRCAFCGCTDRARCIGSDGPCHWIAAAACPSCGDLCSSCAAGVPGNGRGVVLEAPAR